ncbi:hypothetical protein [Paenibacillus tengchongensis]|uniref:hypothetical protein n=1 Tax=Paenibacillus tengchongensis TaxID=2608684 RepID=UPI00124E057C|nr:hypothetical protein [Paenibacillus tengchongensis]
MGVPDLSDVYAYIHRTLRDDSGLQSLLGLTPAAPLEDRVKHIQKRRQPHNLVQDNLPLITFYKLPGTRGANYLEYRFSFRFDIYTSDDVELAIGIADRINRLFDNRFLQGLPGSSFGGEYITCAEEETDVRNGFKYFTQIGFTIGLDED